MQMSDVIKVLGNTPLKEFPWGCIVKDTVNLFASEGHLLTDESSGEDVHAALDSMLPDVRDLVLSANVDPTRCMVTSPMGGGMVLEYSEEVIGHDVVELRKAMLTPQFVASATMVTIVLIASLVAVSSLSVNQGFEWLEFFKTLLQVIAPTFLGE